MSWIVNAAIWLKLRLVSGLSGVQEKAGDGWGTGHFPPLSVGNGTGAVF